MGGFRRLRWFAPTLAAISGGWAVTVGLTPALAKSSSVGPAVATVAYVVGSLICHQRPDRSFHLAGAQLPVCARCTGLYVGGALGVFAWMIWRLTRPSAAAALDRGRAVVMLSLAAAPTLISVATAMAGVWDLSNAGRAALALPLGVTAGAVLAAVASNEIGRAHV